MFIPYCTAHFEAREELTDKIGMIHFNLPDIMADALAEWKHYNYWYMFYFILFVFHYILIITRASPPSFSLSLP